MKTSLLALALTLPLAAQQAAVNPFAPPPKEAVLFKSGQGWLYRDVKVAENATGSRLRMPDAIHGSVWLGSDTLVLSRARALYDDFPVARPVESLTDLLEASVGKRVSVSLVTGSEVRTEDAEILRIIHPTPPRAVPNQPYYPVPTGRPLVLLFQEGLGVATYPVDSVVGVTVYGAGRDDVPRTYTKLERSPVLDVSHSRPRRGQRAEIGLAHLSNGLAWAPSYVLEIPDDRTANARLVGKAVVINDSEDFIDTRVKLAIGFPNLKFSNVTTALSPAVTLDMFSQMLNARGNAGQAGVMGQQTIMSNAFVRASAPAAPAGPAVPTEGEGSEDLYLYDIGAVTLAKGERMYVPLLEQSIPCRHRYDWDLPDQVDNYARFVRQNPDQEPPPVWHVLQLRNEGEAPWTTAPILIQGTRGPIAQSMLTYTPSQTATKVQLTKALDLVGHAVEFRSDDTNSPRDQRRLFGDLYEKVTVEGRLELTNRKKTAAPIRISKRFSGDLIEAEGDPTARGEAKGLGQINASRLLTWEFELGAGETWTADYRYEVLIRR